ncbi:UDP-glycosyltransferase UGT5-like isoform X1 [Onthophagus taurus]|uniref:UDP-glycosyltransferase UGT5-like isoform X1 n=1 Tax=Onthophagus taurus TaxID=166361 RepID=UPI0039BE5609
MVMLKTLLILFLVQLESPFQVGALNILAVFPYEMRSHFSVFRPLLLNLAKKDHNITVISYYPLEKKLRNYHDVNLNTNNGALKNTVPFAHFTQSRLEKYLCSWVLHKFTQNTCVKALKSPEFLDFLKQNQQFDVVLIELFATNCMLEYIPANSKIIGLSSCSVLPWLSEYFGLPVNPAINPTVFMDYNTRMNFFERVENALVHIQSQFTYKYFMKVRGPKKEIAEKFMYNISLILINSHFTMHEARISVPQMIDVGGLHVSNKKITLPQNIEKWINESSEGVVYFSMGSMLIGHSFPIKKREMFQRAFSRLKHRVLWKWENDTMPGKPDNVMTQKWMPQFDILCHPNVKAFVAHGGLLGMTEAVHCGVPVVVMPQFGDQFTNARALEASGGGVILDFSTITEDNVYEALQKVLNPKFKKQAEELSARFKDRPMSPMDTAIYWIEYVARHKGAPHLKTAAVGMPFYQYLLLDVIAFLLVVFLSICLVSYYTLKMLLKCVYPAKVKKTKTN